MSNYVHRKGFIYPIESGSPDIDEKATILLNKDKFVLANLGKNRYLVWLVCSSCGLQRRTFGHCRQCTSKEIESFAPLFRNVLGDIDTTKLKYIDYCYCDSRDCIIDYYEGEQMTLNSAIVIAREGAKNKYDAAGKDCQQLAGWLQELAGFKDSTPITDGWLRDNGFSETEWVKVGDNLIRCYETGWARWFASVDNDERNLHEKFDRLKHWTTHDVFSHLRNIGLRTKRFCKMENWTIEQAIAGMQDFAKETEMFAGSPNAAKIASWLQVLAGFQDKAPITDEFLARRFVDTRAGWQQNFDGTQILIQRSADTYHVLIFKREYEENKAYIKTVGQLRMFMTICGLRDFVKQLNN